MQPRILVAVNFAIWAYALGKIVPFGQYFLLPVVYIYDKRILAIMLGITSLEILPFNYMALEMLRPFLPVGFIPLLFWLLVASAIIVFWEQYIDIAITGHFLRKKLKKRGFG